MGLRIWQGGAVVVLSWWLFACSSGNNVAPVRGVTEEAIPASSSSRQAARLNRPAIQGSSYVVQKGDTLYSIAFNSGNDVPSLASLNGINPPYNIYPGQQLRLDAASSALSASRSAGTYQVRRGDTLSSIGRQFGMSAQALAMSNSLQVPYALQPGQVLNVQGGSGAQIAAVEPTVRPVIVTKPVVTPPAKVMTPVAKVNSVSVAKLPMPEPTKTAPVAVAPAPVKLNGPQPLVVDNGRGQTTPFIAQKNVADKVHKEYVQTQQPKTSVQTTSTKIAWHWPAKGRIVEGFSTAEQGNKGIDIAGQKGDPVYATSGGKVVYAGSALRGYGKLVILKHDDDYLSAYAHNDALNVKEGDSVRGGQVIANMGSTDAPDVRLHFEIRYRGKSVNPMTHLPKR